jgi:uncharacterized protein (DUF2267 family)
VLKRIKELIIYSAGGSPMQYEEFIKLIQKRGNIKSFGVAERAASAVLEVLGENLAKDEAISLSQQLPTHIRYAIIENNIAECFGLDEFIQRVMVREEVPLKEAENHVRTVLPVVGEVIDVDEVQDALSGLSENIRLVLTGAEVKPSVKKQKRFA